MNLTKKNNQASIYGKLALLAEELSEFGQAKNYYLKALSIFTLIEDKQNSNLVIYQLSILYQKNQDNSLIAEIATMLKITEQEVREQFNKLKINN